MLDTIRMLIVEHQAILGLVILVGMFVAFVMERYPPTVVAVAAVSAAIAPVWGMAQGAGALAASASGVGRVFWGSVTGQIVERHPGPDPQCEGFWQRNFAVM